MGTLDIIITVVATLFVGFLALRLVKHFMK